MSLEETKTCLILGAGISHPYGFPLGADLIEQIKAKLVKEKSHQNTALIRDLADLQPLSIDAFLHIKSEYEKGVKATIAEILFEVEDPAQFDNIATDKHFYRFFFNTIHAQNLSNFSVVSFNYDRSLEYYLARAFRAKLGASGTKSFTCFQDLKIEHIHGRLSELPEGEGKFSNKRMRECIGYGDFRSSSQELGTIIRTEEGPIRGVPGFSHESLLKNEVWLYGQNSFRTVYQNNDKNVDAVKLLEEADRILFLGFSFHPLNMKILGFDNSNSYKNKKISGTCFGMSKMEIKSLQDAFPQLKNLFNLTAVSFFQEKCSLLKPSLDDF